MKTLLTLLIICLPVISNAQLKEIAFAELTTGSGMYFGAQMSSTTITVTVQGPSDRYIAFGFGSGMATGNDAIIWSTTGTGAAPLQLRDHRMVGTGAEPTVDAQQDWTVISNNVSAGNRTIVASRALNTGDANDVTFNFAATSQNLFWAKAASPSNQLSNHGGSNRASGIVRNWVTVDQTAPTLNATTPADNASGVSLTQNLSMSFSENVVLGTGSFHLYDSGNNLIQSVASGGPGLTVSGSSVFWNPTANFVVNTSYYVLIDATTVKDAAGNFYSGISSNTTWNFNTNDVTAPVLGATPFIPADNAVGVALNQDLSVTFNEPIALASGSILLYDNTNTVVESFDVSSSPLVSVVGNSVIINPTNDFTLNNQYYVHIPSGAVVDMSGNLYSGFVTNTTWNWNTNDVVVPTIAGAFTPADNATGVNLSPTLVVTFSEDIQLNATGNASIFNSGGTLIESFTNTSGGADVTGNTLSLTLTTALQDQTGYYIQITSDFVKDLSGNNFAGINDQTTWNFTTGDFTSPQTVSLSPNNGANQVPIASSLLITFNENVNLDAGDIQLWNETTMLFEVFNASSGNTTENGTSITLTPATSLDEGTFYHILIGSDAIIDEASNYFAGISDTTVWRFETESGAGLVDQNFNEYFTWNGKVLMIKEALRSASIWNTNGQKIRELNLETNHLNDLPSGMYFLFLETNSEEKITTRIYVD